MRLLHLLKYLILLCSFFHSPLSALGVNKLIVGYGAHDTAPYAITEAGYLTQGIIKDIIEELSDELNIDVQFVEIPRKRYARYLISNRIHVILISNPAWLGNNKHYNWSFPLFKEADILVQPSNQPAITQLSDLAHKRLGTIRGYIYPQLDELFANKKVIRSDVSSMDLNFIRLSKGWIDAFIDSDILIKYHLLQHDNAQQFQIAPLVISSHNIQAALSKRAPITIEQFNQALTMLKTNGVIDAILNRYQVKPHIPSSLIKNDT